MPYIEKHDNRGTLWKFEKQGNASAPDYKGRGEITCPHCSKSSKWSISSWINQTQSSGEKYLRLIFQKPFTERETQTPPSSAPLSPAEVYDDDIPF